MKVFELINKLQKFPAGADVLISADSKNEDSVSFEIEAVEGEGLDEDENTIYPVNIWRGRKE